MVGDSLYALDMGIAFQDNGELRAGATPQTANAPEIRALRSQNALADEMCISTGGTIAFLHGYSHTGLPGNEVVDERAGKAAKEGALPSSVGADSRANGDWHLRFDDFPVTGGVLHRLIWKQHAHRWKAKLKAQPGQRGMFLLSELDMKVVAGKSRTALAFQRKLKVPQSVALLKLRFGAIRTRERCDPAERECGHAWLPCPHCNQAVMQCEFTERPDLVGHLAYRCTADYPWKLRALRQWQLRRWCEKYDRSILWGDLQGMEWEEKESGEEALLDVRGLLTLGAGQAVRGASKQWETSTGELAQLVGRSAVQLLDCASSQYDAVRLQRREALHVRAAGKPPIDTQGQGGLVSEEAGDFEELSDGALLQDDGEDSHMGDQALDEAVTTLMEAQEMRQNNETLDFEMDEGGVNEVGEEEGGADLGVEPNEDSDDGDDDDIVIPGSPAQTPKKGENRASQAAGSK